MMNYLTMIHLATFALDMRILHHTLIMNFNLDLSFKL